jgi:hypothetical protein
MDILVYNFAFFENSQSTRLVVPLLVVKMTCALQAFHLFSKLVNPTSNFNMGLL